MLSQYRRSIRGFWHKTVIYIIILVMFIQPGILQQLWAAERIVKQHQRLKEEHARARRTYIDPTLPVGSRQRMLSRMQLRTSKRALAKIRTDKDAKSLVKDIEVMHNKLKTTHLNLMTKLEHFRIKLLEKNVSQRILDRHDEFSGAVEDRYQEFDRLLSVVEQNRNGRDKLRTSLKDLAKFLEGEPDKTPKEDSFAYQTPHMPRHGATYSSCRPGSPPYFQWPWKIAAAGEEIWCGLLAEMLDVNSVTGPPDDVNDLAYDLPEISFDPTNTSGDPIVVKAAELDHNPVTIFEYVRNELAYEPYFGSVKGAKRTLEEKAGNDMDLASTLMALLRASDVPCRYVCGVIELSIEEAASWTGVNAPEQVVKLFQDNGICLSVNYAGGEPDTLQLNHVWVKAYVDNFPYRGVVRKDSYDGTSDGDAWIDLDPSFKQHTFTAVHDIEQSIGTDFDPDTLLNAAIFDATIVETEGEKYVFGIDEDLIGEQLLFLAEPIRNYQAARGVTTETIFRQRYVSEERYGLLPITDQYRIIEKIAQHNQHNGHQ